MTAKPRIAVVGAGGTIAGTGPSATSAAYASGRIDTTALLAAIGGLDRVADIVVETLFSTGSEDLGPPQWLQLAARVQALADQPEVDGIVVTHGTDTLEEAAFFLYLVHRTAKPVVLTAAMRASTALSADGAANIHQAVLAASDPRLGHHGVMVAINGLLLSGREVVKTNSVALETFYSYPGGPVGRIVGERLSVVRSTRPAPVEGAFEGLSKGLEDLPAVGVVYLYGGCRDAPLRRWRGTKVGGLVIAAFGAGTMPAEMAKMAREMADEGCVIIVSSRVGEVVVQPETMTLNGGRLLPSGVLNPAKSVVLLSLALAEGLSADRIAELLGQLGGEAPTAT